MSATKQFSLTDEEIAAILTALRVRINDLHRLADNIDASDDPGLCRAHALRAIGRQQQPPRLSNKQRCRATSKHSRERCRNYAMTGKGVCRIHGGATPPWRWRTVTRWDRSSR